MRTCSQGAMCMPGAAAGRALGLALQVSSPGSSGALCVPPSRPDTVSLLQGLGRGPCRGCGWDFRGEDCPRLVVREHRVLSTALCVRPSCPSCALDCDEDRTRVAENPGGPSSQVPAARFVPVSVFTASLWAGHRGPSRVTAGAAEARAGSAPSAAPWADCGAQGLEHLAAVSCTLSLQRCASRVCFLLCDSVFSRRWARKGVRWGPFSAGTLTYPEKVR